MILQRNIRDCAVSQHVARCPQLTVRLPSILNATNHHRRPRNIVKRARLTEQFRDPMPNQTAALPKRLNEQDSKRIRCPDAKDIAAGIGRRFDQQLPAGAPQIGHEPGMG
eukprot:COSAG06_NODE_11562_length_1491_cov_1.456178_3_plen_110_part_00